LVYNVAEIDYHTITVIFASIMTGAVVAMGMKYAGTGDKKAVATIQWHIDRLRSMKILKCELANDPMNKNSIDQYNLFTLLCVSMLSLSLLMAVTCDVECLKIARVIRKRIQETANFHYGFNMAVNMAIGFLCLGYGNYSFNRSDMSIAALLISIYPYFPNSPSDNKWHLQALRHFYVLAVEEKVFHAVDVDTNKVVNVNLEMQFEVDNTLVSEQLHTPVLLQESRKLTALKIRDEDFFDVDFAFDRTTVHPKVIYIKKKFSKDIDLHHFKSLNPEDYEHLPVTA
jgi:anaphase-promoting complex subunit 1